MEVLFSFTEEKNTKDWKIVDDGVMGGLSQGQFFLNKHNNAVFEGKISLKNNGGFSSVQYTCGKLDVEKFSTFVLRVKGDGNPFQFRVKNSLNERHSYIYEFATTGEWQIIKIKMSAMKPQFRGNALSLPNYAGKSLEQITFLFGNKKAEHFKLEIDEIAME